ncbi:hypothetical protein ACFPOE_01960 [Caenimonas terrae]|uniref:Integrase n=1 Tax=Caenimonas terrae TaxID=696074 RepID=A0ABW0N9N4_9BURK
MSKSQQVAAGATASTQSDAAPKSVTHPKSVYRPMGVPYQLASGLWAIRARHRNQTFCLSGFADKSQARTALVQRLRGLQEGQRLKPATVALALQHYGLAHLPRLRGALQEARIINTYLRAAGERTIEVRTSPAAVAPYQTTLFGRAVVSLVATYVGRDAAREGGVPAIQVTRSARLRAELAVTRMDQVTSGQIHALLQALEAEGRARATVLKERSLLARLFKDERRFGGESWGARNPVDDVRLHGHGRRRTRAMTASEHERLETAFKTAGDANTARMFVLLSESGMDAKYCVDHASWDEILWGHRLFCRRGLNNPSSLTLLSDKAMGILEEMRPAAGPSPRIFSTPYASFKHAWRSACRTAGVEDLRIQDLRRSGRSGWNFVSHDTLQVLHAYSGRVKRL